jgi:hypothetical protein
MNHEIMEEHEQHQIMQMLLGLVMQFTFPKKLLRAKMANTKCMP